MRSRYRASKRTFRGKSFQEHSLDAACCLSTQSNLPSYCCTARGTTTQARPGPETAVIMTRSKVAMNQQAGTYSSAAAATPQLQLFESSWTLRSVFCRKPNSPVRGSLAFCTDSTFFHPVPPLRSRSHRATLLNLPALFPRCRLLCWLGLPRTPLPLS